MSSNPETENLKVEIIQLRENLAQAEARASNAEAKIEEMKEVHAEKKRQLELEMLEHFNAILKTDSQFFGCKKALTKIQNALHYFTEFRSNGNILTYAESWENLMGDNMDLDDLL